MERYIIDAFWDYEAQVWIATSDDILGLVTEAENIDILIQKVRVIVTELLVLNHQVKNNNTQIKWDLIIHHQELLEVAS
ncbi:DUF1902 domain-containing protein [Geminocystis sp. GBBB08]|uniref:DUF1902 domain-containing protein n=1 Tax=Geminocystis sp. GBBB08 TaxID=2604140 RepID=UPI0027E2A021|nr:DUF1902 domain-containing protein [Geminocystis sp. GBBB08]MBL1210066.1 DUF1902 domain-containing protein [Geminocystis sp. GBBB08]